MSRRLLLALPLAGLVGGCASETDRINRLVFGAVRKDPLFLWRPDWMIKATDMERPLGGIYPEAAAGLSHALKAAALPTSAVSDATGVAVSSGWQPGANGIGLVKPIPASELSLWVLFSVTPETQVLTMTFSGQNT